MRKLITPEEHTAGFKEYLGRYFEKRGIAVEELGIQDTERAYQSSTGFGWIFKDVDCTTNFYRDSHGKLGFFNEMEFTGDPRNTFPRTGITCDPITIEKVFKSMSGKTVDQQSQYFARPVRLFVQGGLSQTQMEQQMVHTEGHSFHPSEIYVPTSKHVQVSCFQPYLNGEEITACVHHLLSCRVKPNPAQIARDKAPGKTHDPKYNRYDLYRDAFAFLVRNPLGVATGLTSS